MTSKKPEQTPIEQPSPAEAPAPQTVNVTADEAALLEAYRNAEGGKILELFAEKHTPPPLPDDYAFPHDAAFTDDLISQYYPDATYFAKNEYRERYGVDSNVANQAVERIFEKAKAAGLSKDETRLLAAYRVGDTDKMKSLAFNSYYAHQPEPPGAPDPAETLDFEQRMAVIIIGEMAKHSYLYKWQLEDDQYLPLFIQTIAAAIGDNMEHMDSEEVKRYFVSPGSDWPK